PDVQAHARDRPVDVEAATADDDVRREVVLVDERDPRLRARVPGDKADEAGDDERVGDEDRGEERRAPQDAQVLPEQQEDVHARTAATGSPSKTSLPSSSLTTRPAWPETSSTFWVAKTTAPPASRSSSTRSQSRPRCTGSREAVGSSRRSTRGEPRSAIARFSRWRLPTERLPLGRPPSGSSKSASRRAAAVFASGSPASRAKSS